MLSVVSLLLTYAQRNTHTYTQSAVSHNCITETVSFELYSWIKTEKNPSENKLPKLRCLYYIYMSDNAYSVRTKLSKNQSVQLAPGLFPN